MKVYLVTYDITTYTDDEVPVYTKWYAEEINRKEKEITGSSTDRENAVVFDLSKIKDKKFIETFLTNNNEIPNGVDLENDIKNKEFMNYFMGYSLEPINVNLIKFNENNNCDI